MRLPTKEARGIRIKHPASQPITSPTFHRTPGMGHYFGLRGHIEFEKRNTPTRPAPRDSFFFRRFNSNQFDPSLVGPMHRFGGERKKQHFHRERNDKKDKTVVFRRRRITADYLEEAAPKRRRPSSNRFMSSADGLVVASVADEAPTMAARVRQLCTESRRRGRGYVVQPTRLVLGDAAH